MAEEENNKDNALEDFANDKADFEKSMLSLTDYEDPFTKLQFARPPSDNQPDKYDWVFYFGQDTEKKKVKYVFSPVANTVPYMLDGDNLLNSQTTAIKEMKNFTFLYVDPEDSSEIVVTDQLGREKVYRALLVMDENPEFLGGTKKGATVFIENTHLYSMPHYDEENGGVFFTDTEIPQVPIKTDRLDSKSSLNKKANELLWYKKNNGHILELDKFFLATMEVPVIANVTPGGQNFAEDDAVLNAFRQVMQAEEKVEPSELNTLKPESKELRRFIENYAKAIDRKITPWPPDKDTKSYKLLVSVDKSKILALTADPSTDPSKGLFYTHTLVAQEKVLSQYINNITDYFESLYYVVKSSNVRLDLRKEAKYLQDIFQKIKSIYKPFIENDKFFIYLYFDENSRYNLVGMQVHDGKSDSFKNPPKTVSIKDLKKEKNPIFSRLRTLLYLINIDVFIREIGKPYNFEKNSKPWIPLLSKYTYKMPEYYPGTAKESYTDDQTKPLDMIKKAEEKLGAVPKSDVEENRILASITPVVKGAAVNTIKNSYTKIQDIAFTALLSADPESTDVYKQVVNNIGVKKLIDIASAFMQGKDHGLKVFKNKINFNQLEDKYNKLSNKNLVYRKPTGDEAPAFDMGDVEEIETITSHELKKAVNKIEFEITKELNKQFHNLLQIVKDALDKSSESSEAGDISLAEITPKSNLTVIKNKLKTFPTLANKQFDIATLLEIVSQSATPRQLIAIFEERGDFRVIEIIRKNIIEEFPFFSVVLEDVYDTEEFLVMIGEYVLRSLIDTTAKAEILNDKVKDQISNFCAEDREQIETYLLENFSDEFIQNQANKDVQDRKDFEEHLSSLQGSLEDGLKEYLFGDKLDKILDFSFENKALDRALEQTTDIYLSPVETIFDLECFHINNYFLALTSSTIDSLKNSSFPSQSPSYQYFDEDEAAQSKTGKQTVLVKEPSQLVTNLKSSLEQGANFPILETQDGIKIKYILGNGAGSMGLNIGYMKQPIGAIEKGDEGIYYYEFDGEDINKLDLNAKDSVSLKYDYLSPAGTPIFENSSVVNLRNANIHSLIKEQDIGFTPQASAYSAFVNNLIFKYKSQYPNFITSIPQQSALTSFVTSSKSKFYIGTLYEALKTIRTSTVKSKFFNSLSLRRLSLVQTETTEFSSDFLSLNQNENNDEAWPPSWDFFDLDETKENIKRKNNYFELQGDSLPASISSRSSFDNSILFESIEIMIKVFALENLVGGIFVYDQLKLDKPSFINNNSDLLTNVVMQQITRLGEDFREDFLQVLNEYTIFRSTIPERTQHFAPLPDDFEPGNVTAMLNFLIKEQMTELYDDLQVCLKAATREDFLVENSFLNLIPMIDSPLSSKSLTANFVSDTEGLDENFRKHGGFVLEKYIRTDYTPVSFAAGKKVVEDLVMIKSKEKEEFLPVHGAYYVSKGPKSKQTAVSNYSSLISAFLLQISHGTDLGIHEIFAPLKYESLKGDYLAEKQKSPRAGLTYLSDLGKKHNVNFGDFQKLYEEENFLNKNAFFIKGSLNEVVSQKAFFTFQKELLEHNASLEDQLNDTQAILDSLKNKTSTVTAFKEQLSELVYDGPYGETLYDQATNMSDLISSYKSHISYTYNTFKYGSWFDGSKMKPTSANITISDDFLKDVSFTDNEQPIREELIKDWIAEYVDSDAYFDLVKEVTGTKMPVGKPHYGFLAEIDEEVLEDFLNSLNARESLFSDLDNTRLIRIERYLDGCEQLIEFYEKLKNIYIPYAENVIKWNKDKSNTTSSANYGKTIGSLEVATETQDKIDEAQKLLAWFETWSQGDTLFPKVDKLKKDLEKANELRENIEDILKGDYSSDILEVIQGLKGDLIQAKIEDVQFRGENIVSDTYDQYFNSLKYGIRLVYLFPEKEGTTDLGGFEIENPLALEFSKLTDSPLSNINIYEKTFRIEELVLDEIENKVSKESISDLSSQNTLFKGDRRTYHCLPLLSYEKEVSGFFLNQENGEPLAPSLTDLDIPSKLDVAAQILKQELSKSQDYKDLITDILLYNNLSSLMGTYCTLSSYRNLFSKFPFGYFSGTKTNLKAIIQGTLNESDYKFTTFDDSEAQNNLNNFVNDQNVVGDPKDTGFDTSSIGYAAIFAAQTGLNILKGIAEQTDPAVILGKQIQDVVVAAAKVASSVNETVGQLAGEENAVKKEDLDSAEEALKSDTALAGIVFTTVLPFPIGPNLATPITPYGFAYLLQSAAFEMAEVD